MQRVRLLTTESSHDPVRPHPSQEFNMAAISTISGPQCSTNLRGSVLHNASTRMVLRSGAPAAHGLGGVSLPARRSLRSGARMSGTVAVHAVMDSSAIEGVVQQLYTLADASMEVVPETSQNTGWLAPIVGVLETVLKVRYTRFQYPNCRRCFSSLLRMDTPRLA